MQEQKQFRYIYNNEEVSREDFEKLAGDSFKWFDGGSIVSVPFSSFDSSFNGDFKSRRQINDHLDSVLNVYQNKVTEDIINKPKCSPQCFCDGSCKKPQEKNTNSTRHKSQAGETHKENEDTIKIISHNKEDVQEGGWVGKNGAKFRVKINKILKPLDVITINELWGLYLIIEEVNGYDCTLRIMNSENDEYIQYPCELLNGKPDYHIISNSYTKEYISKIKNRISAEKGQKDDVITNSNRGEKETMEYLQSLKQKQEWVENRIKEDKKLIEEIGVKYNQLKPRLDVVINTQFPKALQLIALATEYGNSKYKETDLDMLNFKRVVGGSQTYFDSCARHSTDRNGLDESGLPHIIHAVWSSLAGLELWAEENRINIKEFTENYMKNLQD